MLGKPSASVLASFSPHALPQAAFLLSLLGHQTVFLPFEVDAPLLSLHREGRPRLDYLVSGDVQNSSCSIYADTFALAAATFAFAATNVALAAATFALAAATFALAAATYESSSAGEEVKLEVKSGASFAATRSNKKSLAARGRGQG